MRLLKQQVPDHLLSAQEVFGVIGDLYKGFLVLALANTKAHIGAVGVNFQLDTSYYPSSILLNTYSSVQIQNTSDTVFKVTEFRYVARQDNNDTTTDDGTTITSLSAAYPQYDAVPSDWYQAVEGSNPLDHGTFWRFHKPFRPRTRLVRPGKVVCFNTYSRGMLGYTDLTIGINNNFANPGVGMIRNKTVRAVYVFEVEQGGYCAGSVSFPVASQKYLRAGPGSYTMRMIQRVQSRCAVTNFPSVLGDLNPDGMSINEDANLLVPAPGHELHYARSTTNIDGFTTERSVRQVNYPPQPCDGTVVAPYVAITGQPIEVTVVP